MCNSSDSEFISDYQAAWAEVESEIEMNAAQLRSIKKGFIPLFNGGIDNAYRNLKDVFNKHHWKWQHLDEIIALFKGTVGMPPMLIGCYDESITTDIPELDEVLTWFTVPELKAYCKEAGLKAKGKKSDIVEAIIADGQFKTLWGDKVKQRYKEVLIKKLDEVQKRWAIVLLHYVVMKYYGIKKLRDLKSAIKRNPSTVVALSVVRDNEAEPWFVEQVVEITPEVYPPFFPGDRTSLLIFRDSKQVPEGMEIIPTAWILDK